MKKKLFYSFLIFALAVILGTSVINTVEVNAASKPAMEKKKVTLYTNSDPYTIQINNLAKNATVKYKSSNKKIITVSKKGEVKPVAEGKASVKATVKQNGKTYKIKTVFTVKKTKETASNKTGEYKKKAEALIKELDASATVENYMVDTSTIKVISSKEAVDKYIYNKSRYASSRSYLFITDLSQLRSYEEYMDLYPIITSIKFCNVTKYINMIEVEMEIKSDSIMFDDEFAIENAINSGSTSDLNSDELALYKKLSALAKELNGKKEYDTVKNIHDYIVLNTLYPMSYSGNSIHTVSSALNEGKAVCDGYSKLFYFLCKMNGIDCVLVTGTATDSTNYTEDHAWNKVKINGKWYAIDVTWDDPCPDEKGRVLYDYFLVTDEDMNRNHKTSMKNLPEATSKDLGIIYNKYADYTTRLDTTKEVKNYMSKCIDEVLGKKYDLTIKFIYTKSDISIEDTINDVLLGYNKKYGCGYSLNRESAGILGLAYTIRVFK